MNEKHEHILREAARALSIGRVDHKLADSLHGIIASDKAAKAKGLPSLPRALYEEYPTMSAQAHEAAVKAYAKRAAAASK